MAGNTIKDENSYRAFVYPISLASLKFTDKGLIGNDGKLFKFLDTGNRVIDFIEPFITSDFDRSNLEMYNAHNSIEIYRNFLDRLFKTFSENEDEFRRNLIGYLRLSKGDKVLITGCGLGDDISIISECVGSAGEIHAQDLSKAMVIEASRKNRSENVCFSVSNGNSLPYTSRYFDAVFHFGGINLFGDTRRAISELERVCKIGGRVVFGDEGISPHLRGTEYAEMAIKNNNLWAAETPMNMLPHNADEIQINYILGNCFYLIGFTPAEGFPAMNIDVPHKGIRGGTMRTRYFGQIEGVTEGAKLKLISKAKELNISVHDLLEKLINSNI
jgi:ubiquinone/menaquinone biosynthesis C-methylase UbiE